MELAEVVELVTEVAAEGCPARRLACLRRVRSWLDAREATLASEVAATTSLPERVIAEAAGTGWRAAERVLERAELLTAAPVLEEALESGTITSGHVDAIARGLRALEPDEQDAFLDHVDTLARSAAHTPTDRFARTVSAAMGAARRRSDVERLVQQVRDSRLSLWQEPGDGMWRLSGRLDAASGRELQRRLGLAAARVEVGEHAPTDPLERAGWVQAQALLALTDTGSRGQPPPTAVVDLRGEHPIIDWGAEHAVPAEVTRVLLRYAPATFVIIGPAGEICAPGRLDLGRTARFASPAQRRALRALYPTCAIPGCPVRFDDLDIHHVVEFDKGGRTDFDELLPICRHDHTRAHAEGWALTLLADRTLRIDFPDGTSLTTGPPGRT